MLYLFCHTFSIRISHFFISYLSHFRFSLSRINSPSLSPAPPPSLMGDRNNHEIPTTHVHEPFDESFWRSYLDSLNSSTLQSSGDFAPVSPKKYTSSSPAVATIIKYFEALKLPIPPTTQIVALLKSPFTFGDVTRTFFLIRFFQVSRAHFVHFQPAPQRHGNKAFGASSSLCESSPVWKPYHQGHHYEDLRGASGARF